MPHIVFSFSGGLKRLQKFVFKIATAPEGAVFMRVHGRELYDKAKAPIGLHTAATTHTTITSTHDNLLKVNN
jgi:hypothetical protein